MKTFLTFLLSLALIVDSSVIRNDAEITTISTPNATKPLIKPWPANSTVCYDYVGCFSNNAPNNNTGLFLPIDPILINTSFQLFTPNYANNGQFLSYRDVNTVKNSIYDKSLPLKIVVHGFSNDLNSEWLHTLKDALLTTDSNVIITGWGNGATFPLYNNATSNIRVVGKELSLLVKIIRDTFYPNAVEAKKFNIHCIGHSLGSHICGLAGTHSKASDIYFDRISAMDPAGPFFEDQNELIRLDTGDAKFVDAYHTNGGSLVTFSFGYLAPIGHVDFFVNGGSAQPGCPSLTSIIAEVISSGGQADPSKSVGCSHNRVIELYTESITLPVSFVGFKCTSMDAFDSGACRTCDNDQCSELGINADKYKARGSLFLYTLDKAPYAANHYFFSISIASNSNKTAGELILTIGDSTVTLIKADTDINPGATLGKLFVIPADVTSGDSASIKFNKRPKKFWELRDPNAPTFIYEKVSLYHLAVSETLNKCGSETIGDKQVIENRLNYDC